MPRRAGREGERRGTRGSTARSCRSSWSAEAHLVNTSRMGGFIPVPGQDE